MTDAYAQRILPIIFLVTQHYHAILSLGVEYTLYRDTLNGYSKIVDAIWSVALSRAEYIRGEYPLSGCDLRVR